MENKTIYFATQTWLLSETNAVKKTILPKQVPTKEQRDDVSLLADGKPAKFRTIVEDMFPYQIFYRCFTYNDTIEADIAFAISCDTTVDLYIESIEELIHFPALKQLAHVEYKHAFKADAFMYIHDIIKSFEPEMEYYNAYREVCNERSTDPVKFKLTQEIETFITNWAPAYGIPTPRFHAIDNSNERDLPKQWVTNIEGVGGLREKCTNLNKSLAKWDSNSIKSLRPNSLYDIKRTLDSLLFYRRNNIPLTEDYSICKKCGLPYRNTASIIDSVNHVFISMCEHCGTTYEADNAEVDKYSYQDYTVVPTKGRKIITTSKD